MERRTVKKNREPIWEGWRKIKEEEKMERVAAMSAQSMS